MENAALLTTTSGEKYRSINMGEPSRQLAQAGKPRLLKCIESCCDARPITAWNIACACAPPLAAALSLTALLLDPCKGHQCTDAFKWSVYIPLGVTFLISTMITEVFAMSLFIHLKNSPERLQSCLGYLGFLVLGIAAILPLYLYSYLGHSDGLNVLIYSTMVISGNLGLICLLMLLEPVAHRLCPSWFENQGEGRSPYGV